MVSAEIAVAMAVPIENSAECEVRGVIRFLQDDEILGYLAKEASSRAEIVLQTMHVRILPGRHKLCCVSKFHWDIFEHPPYSLDLAQTNVFLFPKLKEHLAGKLFISDDLKDAG